MSVVRRAAAGAVVAGLVVLGGPAWAQEDPCAPGPDGQVPEMCQSGPDQPISDTGTVGMEPEDPCAGSQPVEPGDGVVSHGGGSGSSEGIAEGEPAPGTDPGPEAEPAPGTEPGREDPAEPAPGEPKPEPPPGDETQPEPGPDSPGAISDDTVICAFGVPVMAPGDTAAVPESATAGRGAAVAGQLPRTGPYDRLLALAAIGSGLVLAGAGATVAARRRARV